MSEGQHTRAIKRPTYPPPSLPAPTASKLSSAATHSLQLLQLAGTQHIRHRQAVTRHEGPAPTIQPVGLKVHQGLPQHLRVWGGHRGGWLPPLSLSSAWAQM